MTAASDQFEAVTRRIFHKLAEYFGLEHVEGSRQYSAQDSGVLRQIDITAYRIDGGMVLIECKRHNRPLTIDKVDAFHTVIYTDVGADGGILVSSKGFTDGAVKSAQAKRIALVTLNEDATEQEFILSIADVVLKGTTCDAAMLFRLRAQNGEEER